MSYRITPGSSTPRLYFRWWADDDTAKTDGAAAAISTAAYLRRSAGAWPASGTTVGTLTDGAEGDAYAVGKVIRHASADGLGNLYSIDPPTASTEDGADAIRLLLTVSTGTVDVIAAPLEHPPLGGAGTREAVGLLEANLNAQLVDLLSLIEGIAITGSATFLGADTYTLTTGTLSSGTIEDTRAASGVSHVHTDAAGAIEVNYTYNMNAGKVGVELMFRGRVDGANDTIAVQVYDWVGVTWDTLWNQEGTGGTTSTNRAEPLLAKHTGTGENDGEVRVRFYAASGLSSATLYVDQLLVAKTITSFDLSASHAAQLLAIYNMTTTSGESETLNNASSEKIATSTAAKTNTRLQK